MNLEIEIRYDKQQDIPMGTVTWLVHNISHIHIYISNKRQTAALVDKRDQIIEVLCIRNFQATTDISKSKPDGVITILTPDYNTWRAPTKLWPKNYWDKPAQRLLTKIANLVKQEMGSHLQSGNKILASLNITLKHTEDPTALGLAESNFKAGEVIPILKDRLKEINE